VPDEQMMAWRVSPKLTALKAVGMVAFPAAAIAFGGDPVRLVVGVLAGLVLAAYVARDVLVPVRVAADTSGVFVASGYAGRRHLPWPVVERIRVDERQRLGTRSELLEIDAGESLHLFSAYELNAPCAEVAAALEELRGRAAGA
jgi:Bacterial PH domain